MKQRVGPQEGSSEGKRDERYRHHLDAHYREIIQAIRDADSILIFGPGEAKGELKKAIKANKPKMGNLGLDTGEA
jgi:stalled ribosome rescue protein Dom34